MVPDDVEPMEVDDDGALIVDLNETVEEDEETKKEKKRRKRFREKLKRFDHYSQFSGISIAQIDWPLIQGRSLQRSPLTGQSFNADENIFRIDEWPRETFLQITSTLTFCAGAALLSNEKITLFVFQRTMKTLVAYCNFMYHRAITHNRRQINRIDVHELISRNPLRFHMFLQKFLPHPDINRTHFNNEFLYYFHNLYFQDETCRLLYHDVARYSPIINQQGTRMSLQHQIYYPDVMRNPAFDALWFTSFINPSGYSFSRFHAYRFHEALGMPPLESELIIVLDWLAKLIICDIGYKVLAWRDARGFQGLPDLLSFQMAMLEEGDPLFDLDIDYTAPPTRLFSEPTRFQTYPKFQPRRRIDFPSRFDGFYKKRRLERGLEEIQESFIMNHFPTKPLRTVYVYTHPEERRR
ncbi:Protein CBR-FEM-3 [Caenorhabditis briggsae]|uniref:Sex-determination protein fem-3 n=1 Tax=Caenorhabditis briggsae TaxID=6238 RepID=FEM3_CAEBR|nr:Protein CBR-FEM-3 [Caenorhabditis briggsae]Q8I8U6.2 RecName: Full=Sex-determination protein fem-3; AltName: Full=Cb-FEM-3 [Caenorhabditis briggsae]CAP38403.1 Protein CBR-FEM-3 [Caenorhabditis briggsae]